MDQVTSAALAGLVVVAAAAAKETTTKLASTAWQRIKARLGWTSEPPAAEIEAKAAHALAANPELAKEIQSIVNDYGTQVAAISTQQSGSVTTGNIQAKTALTGNQTFTGPVTFS